MTGFADYDLAGKEDERYPTTEYIFYFAGGPSDWKSQKRSIAALSVDAEISALSKAGRQSVYLRHLVLMVDCEQKAATTFQKDNQGAVILAYSSEYHPRTTHIGLQCHYIMHLTEERTTDVKCILTHIKK